jgi:predicted transcriptional regulator
MGERQDPARAAIGEAGFRAGEEPGHGRGTGHDGGGAGGEPGHARDDVAVYRFIERFSSVLGEAGFPRMPARVFVALLTSDTGLLTAAEIAELLHASPAAVSGGVRYLIQVGLVSSEREPGSRRRRYRMPDNVWHEMIGDRDRMFSRWIRVLQDGIEVLGPATPAGSRMTSTVRYFGFLQAEMHSLLARWREREAAYGEAADREAADHGAAYGEAAGREAAGREAAGREIASSKIANSKIANGGGRG